MRSVAIDILLGTREVDLGKGRVGLEKGLGASEFSGRWCPRKE